ncbi:hypothetical protein AADG42_10145 [Ammonicoccus fulvus]|uniref:Uncharacterized protein n=1 Tax=Ammonicoccus fulvus TaxID=3138240 RepID=A0ABZ3FSU5_9ACTN
MPENTIQEAVEDLQTVETPAEDSVSTDDETADTFPREYVEKLRSEAAEARVKAKRADTLARELFVARVAATGRLADPSDLDFSDELLADPAAMDAAIDDLIARKPHLATRTPRGSVGQGVSEPSNTVNLAAILRAGTH